MVKVTYTLDYVHGYDREWYIYVSARDVRDVKINKYNIRISVNVYRNRKLESMNPPRMRKIGAFECELKTVKEEMEEEVKKKVKEIIDEVVKFVTELITVLDKYNVTVTGGALELFIRDAIKEYNKMDDVVVDVFVH